MKMSINRTGLLSILTAATITGAGLFIGSPSAAADPAISAAVDPKNFSVQRSSTSSSLIQGLDDALPNHSVSTVIDSANRKGTTCSAPADHRAASFCWESGDNSVKYWMPQGITSSADATSSGTYDGKQVLLSSWYDNGTGGADRGARISFVDMSIPSAPEYRHVLLVEPTGTASAPSYKPVYSHAGGLVWYGDLLYVCDTYNGFRVFDMKHLLKTNNSDSNLIGRQSNGSYAARGYAYVMPQVASYKPTTSGGVDNLRFSQVSLDRTSSPDSLVISEYANTNGSGDGARIVRFNLNTTGWITTDDGTTARADWAWQVNIRSMQGAAAVNGKYYIGRSNGDATKSDMFTWVPGNWAVEHNNSLPIGSEDMSYWGPKGQLWSQTEYPGKRYVYATTRSAW